MHTVCFLRVCNILASYELKRNSVMCTEAIFIYATLRNRNRHHLYVVVTFLGMYIERVVRSQDINKMVFTV